MVVRDVTPEPRIERIVTVIAHHEVIVLFYGVCVRFFSVYDYVRTVGSQSVALVCGYDVRVLRQIVGRDVYYVAFFGT